MKHKLLQLITISVVYLSISSCAPKSGMLGLYNEHKRDADLALAIPRWMAKTVLPREVKEDIAPLIDGMKHIRFLYNESDSDNDFTEDFKQLSKDTEYTPYATVSSNDTNISILSKEKNGLISELILTGSSDDMNFLMGVTGRINKQEFLESLEALKSSE